ncbi:extracellular solute-binding protein [Streptomyces sp. BI20]|uniref:extracellular solute-binding protein n=1 Tax=Streptomyces sp. BI20 TaxID=3403460 RepID=UPI003C734CB1
MRHKFFGPTAGAVVLGLLIPLAGCSGESEQTGDATLRLVAAEYGDTPATSSKAFWDKVTGEFTKANPGIKVEVKLVPWADVDRTVTAMVKKGESPDMALMGSYSDFAGDGLLYSSEELLSVTAEANFLAPLAEAGTIDNHLYGLPFVASSRLLFYNEDLFTKAGIAAPKTWSALKAAAAALKEKGVTYPYALPLGPEEAHAEAMIWELSNGGGYVDGAGNYSLASEQNVDTFTWIRDNLVKPGLVGPTPPAELNRKDAFAAFLRGEVGMVNGYPSLAYAAQQKGIKVGTVEMPVSDAMAGQKAPTVGVADWMMAFKANGHREQIGGFLDFLYQDKNLSDFAGRYHLLPSTTSASRSGPGGNTTQTATDEQFLTALRGAQLYPVNDPSWVTVSDTLKRNIGRAVAPTGNPKAVLEEIAAKARGEAAAN